MNLIFLFRRLVFAQVILGIVAFCMAERNPVLLLVAGALGALSWYVVEGPTGRPLPHVMIILGCMVAVGWLLVELVRQHGEVVIAMGHFTMWLQVLLLYGRKSNREYGEILVLSLLQMIGASVLSASMIYGLLLVAYCVLSLFTVLVFQLKSTSDLVMESNQAAAPKGVQVSRPKAVVGRGQRWHFRLVTIGVGITCGVIAVGVFLLLPRDGSSRFNARLFGPLVERQVGFSAVVQLGTDLPNYAGRDPILQVAIRVNGQLQRDDNVGWLLRGAALDRYDPTTHSWVRGTSNVMTDTELPMPAEGRLLSSSPINVPSIDADFVVRGPTEHILFTIFPPSWVRSPDLPTVLFSPRDQQLSLPPESVIGVVRYQVRSPLAGQIVVASPASAPAPSPRSRRGQARLDDDVSSRRWGVDAARIRALAFYALQDKHLTRDPSVVNDPNDLEIAQTLELFLRSNYQYSLVNRSPPNKADPISDFLFTRREGHCELFASALAALARSIGMRSRVITGYRADEYNAMGGYYVVRPSNAHAWTEIDCGADGWRTFDATPPDALAAEHHVERSWRVTLRELYDQVEFAWINLVVSYDKNSRDKVLTSVGRSFEDTVRSERAWLVQAAISVKDFVSRWESDELTLSLTCVTLFFILLGIASLIRRAVVWRRRLVALQLTALPRAKRSVLVRQLRFYLTMLDMLERNGFVRPDWQSPFSFAQELAAAQPQRFDAVVALTELFYEIRFGYRQIDKERHKNIDAYLGRLSQALSRKA